eukprot:Amastigsp_a353556_6.p3 type:complete len:187 gc:universal Amastigsp_a353556_6:1272-712(-)
MHAAGELSRASLQARGRVRDPALQVDRLVVCRPLRVRRRRRGAARLLEGRAAQREADRAAASNARAAHRGERRRVGRSGRLALVPRGHLRRRRPGDIVLGPLASRARAAASSARVPAPPSSGHRSPAPWHAGRPRLLPQVRARHCARRDARGHADPCARPHPRLSCRRAHRPDARPKSRRAAGAPQ